MPSLFSGAAAAAALCSTLLRIGAAHAGFPALFGTHEVLCGQAQNEKNDQNHDEVCHMRNLLISQARAFSSCSALRLAFAFLIR